MLICLMRNGIIFKLLVFKDSCRSWHDWCWMFDCQHFIVWVFNKVYIMSKAHLIRSRRKRVINIICVCRYVRCLYVFRSTHFIVLVFIKYALRNFEMFHHICCFEYTVFIVWCSLVPKVDKLSGGSRGPCLPPPLATKKQCFFACTIGS